MSPTHDGFDYKLERLKVPTLGEIVEAKETLFDEFKAAKENPEMGHIETLEDYLAVLIINHWKDQVAAEKLMSEIFKHSPVQPPEGKGGTA